MPCIQISCNLSFNLLKDARSEKGLASKKSLNDLQTLKQSIMKLKRIISAALIFTLMFSFSDIFAQRSHHRYQQQQFQYRELIIENGHFDRVRTSQVIVPRTRSPVAKST